MRAVLDTNVVVSALVWGGKPTSLFQAAAEGEMQLFTSPVLLDEVRDVLSRGHLAPRLKSRRFSMEQAIALYGELAISITPATLLRAVPGDPDDDHIITAAVTANVDLSVSGDRHLLSLALPAGLKSSTLSRRWVPFRSHDGSISQPARTLELVSAQQPAVAR